LSDLSKSQLKTGGYGSTVCECLNMQRRSLLIAD
jgi:hypothetical protein